MQALGPDFHVVQTAIVPDELGRIVETLLAWSDDLGLDLVLTTGGTGFAPRDITPEATRSVIDRDAPGLAEAMRAASLRITPHAMLSRAVAGMRASNADRQFARQPQRRGGESADHCRRCSPHAIELLREAPDAEKHH